MNYPTTIYVGDTVTFTAVLNPVDGTPDSIEWRLMEFEQETDAGGIPSTSWTELNGTGESWSAEVNLATKAIIAGSGAWTEIRVKVTCDGTVSNDDKEFGVKPYVLTGIDEVGGTDEGDTRTYKAITDPAIAPVEMLSWSRNRTSTWGSSDDTTMTGMGTEVQKDEIDPGVWEIDLWMDSGGYTSSATISVQIDPAKVSGLTHVQTLCSDQGDMSVEYTLQSSTGRAADLDHTSIGEVVTYLKNDGTAPNPFVADEPFAYPANWVNPKVKEFGELPSPSTTIYDVHGPVFRSAAAVQNGTTGSLFAKQEYFAKYGDGPDPADQEFFPGGTFDIMRYIGLDANGNLRYRITKHGTCNGPPTEQLP